MQFPTLIQREVLMRRIAELAVDIGGSFLDEPPCLVAVMEGARTFADQLCRKLPGRPKPHSIRAASYGSATESGGQVKIMMPENLPVQGRVVILIEDIVDTGHTATALRQHLLSLGAAEVKIATLLSKPSRRVVDIDLEWIGFEIPNEFVIGFGMDADGRFRDLDHIAVFREAMVEEA